jgi:hypothetical protein
MKREVWKKLSKERQETWEKLNNDNKANFLGYTNKKLESRSESEKGAFITEVLTQVQDKDDDDDRRTCLSRVQICVSLSFSPLTHSFDSTAANCSRQ